MKQSTVRPNLTLIESDGCLVQFQFLQGAQLMAHWTELYPTKAFLDHLGLLINLLQPTKDPLDPTWVSNDPDGDGERKMKNLQDLSTTVSLVLTAAEHAYGWTYTAGDENVTQTSVLYCLRKSYNR